MQTSTGGFRGLDLLMYLPYERYPVSSQSVCCELLELSGLERLHAGKDSIIRKIFS